MAMRFYTTEQIGKTRRKTPEGFWLIEGVPIARTGVMEYGPDETPVRAPAGPDGRVYIERTAEQVFRPETIDSFNGKPLVNEHPDEDINPDNWGEEAIGVIFNVRRGKGDESDLLLADIMVYTAAAIQLVEDGKVELSCGYDADYVQTAVGRGEQVNIVGNHVALVERGRCGVRCSIGDNAYNHEGKAMTKIGKALAAVRTAFKTKDEAAFEKGMESVKDALGEEEGGGESGTHIHVHTEGEGSEPARTKYTDEALEAEFKKHDENHAKAMDAIATNHAQVMDAIAELKPKEEGNAAGGETVPEEKVADEMEEEAPEGTSTEDARKTKDSALLTERFQETVAIAEIIAPGIKVPTFDATAKPSVGLGTICGLRRRALDAAIAVPEDAAIIKAARGGRALTKDSLKRMTCDSVRTLFFNVGTAKRASNNRQQTHDSDVVVAGGGLGVTGPIKTPADLNKKFRERFGEK